MVEAAQPAIASGLQHTMPGVAITPMSLGPLRVDGNDPPSSGKMVSLADLHGPTNTPGHIPGEMDAQVSFLNRFSNIISQVPSTAISETAFVNFSQAIDPLDPVLQQLVQDKSFYTAVQNSQLHAAAGAAVKVFRVSSKFSRLLSSLFKFLTEFLSENRYMASKLMNSNAQLTDASLLATKTARQW